MVSGQVLVLSAGTLAYAGNHPDNATLSTPDACQVACGKLPWCNGWTFCNKANGCGSGCSAFAAKNPKLNAPAMQPVNSSLPITAFGPYTYPYDSNGCQYIYTGPRGPRSTDAWPFGMCTLKQLRDPALPAFAKPPGGAAGWVSGTIRRPKVCQDLGTAACTACAMSKDPQACYQCAWDDRVRSRSGLGYLLPGGDEPQVACAACADMPAGSSGRTECLSCLLQQRPCAQCVLGARMYGPAGPDIGSCLTCERQLGQQAVGGCNACAQSAQQSRCMACLAKFPFNYCPAPASQLDVNTLPPPQKCQQPLDSTPCDVCANGARSQAAFDACVACHASGRVNSYECGGCLSASDAASQLRCYQCTKKAHFPSDRYFGCAACFGEWQAPGNIDKCLACVESPKTPAAAKQECSYCYGEYGPATLAARGKCVACLQQPHADYADCELLRKRRQR